MDHESNRSAVIFGIYPGGVAGASNGTMASGPPDDDTQIASCLDALRGESASLLLRAYCIFDDDRGSGDTDTTAPVGAERYATASMPMDVVAQYHSRTADIDGYADFVRNIVDRFGSTADSIQITEEPNVQGNPTLDGDYPHVVDAMIAGVDAARSRADELGLQHLRIGINTTPMFGSAVSFLRTVTHRGGRSFVNSLDYIGLDMFPDVFAPIAATELGAAVAGLLTHHRSAVMEPAGLGHLPLRITENGWPTGSGRSSDAQAVALDKIIGAVAELEESLNIEAYELFSLRDADSSNPDIFHRFGIVTDDYRPKPAFEVVRRAIANGSRITR